jgi:hypothetical protein
LPRQQTSVGVFWDFRGAWEQVGGPQ